MISGSHVCSDWFRAAVAGAVAVFRHDLHSHAACTEKRDGILVIPWCLIFYWGFVSFGRFLNVKTYPPNLLIYIYNIVIIVFIIIYILFLKMREHARVVSKLTKPIFVIFLAVYRHFLRQVSSKPKPAKTDRTILRFCKPQTGDHP